MSRNHLLFLKDMRESCEKIQRYVHEITHKEFLSDDKTYDAVLRNLIVIGEAAKNVPEKVRNFYTDVAWREISGFRDIAVHNYFGIDEDILWDIIQNEIPALLINLNPMVVSEEKKASNKDGED